MLFNSYIFIFVFLPVVLAVYCFVRRYPERTWTIAWLVLASFVYYAWWKPQFLLLLLVSIMVNAGFGKVLCGGRLSRVASQAVLATGILFNLSVLGYFKYAGFFVENLNDWFGAGFSVPKIILPLGISFITFQKIAFLVDAHRGQVRDFSFPNFALFVSFFPQLIAGPIVHHAEVMPQFANKPSAEKRLDDFAVGLSIFCVGLFKKVVIADALAVHANAGFDVLKAGQTLDFASAWIAVLAFSFQLYYDFSGYSDMAVGLARLFGIRFPANFHSPYKATGIIEFWRRWHITLSRFLRDYLYIPLGGNRHGALCRYLNLAVVMLLGGFWHGANWTFVAWGAVHGGMLAINHAWSNLRISNWAFVSSGPARATFVMLTFFAVTLAWVPFRAESIGDAGRMLATLFPLGPNDPSAWASFHPFAKLGPAIYLLLGVGVATFLLPNTYQIFARFDPVLNMSATQLDHRVSLNRLDWKVALVLSGMFVFSVLQLSRVSPFLYFQF